MLNNFPNDIITDILLKLQVNPLLRFKGVCKSWCSLIKDRQFIKQHYDHLGRCYINCQKVLLACPGKELINIVLHYYSIDGPLRRDSGASLLETPVPGFNYRLCYGFVNSCYGLVLLYMGSKIVLWNPAIKESRTIKIEEEQYAFYYSLGYVSSLDDYKIVQVRPKVDSVGYRFKIFSTKSDLWKSIGELDKKYYLDRNMAVADGIVYMIIKYLKRSILCLCLKNEKLEEIPYPGRQTCNEETTLFTQGESLFLAEFLFNSYGLTDMELWCMKGNVMSCSWIKTSVITFPPSTLDLRNFVQPMGFTRDGILLFLSNENTFVFYDLKRRELEKAKFPVPTCSYPYRAVTYVESLISPNAL